MARSVWAAEFDELSGQAVEPQQHESAAVKLDGPFMEAANDLVDRHGGYERAQRLPTRVDVHCAIRCRGMPGICWGSPKMRVEHPVPGDALTGGQLEGHCSRDLGTQRRHVSRSPRD